MRRTIDLRPPPRREEERRPRPRTEGPGHQRNAFQDNTRIEQWEPIRLDSPRPLEVINADYAETLRWKGEIDADVANIRAQIESAKAKAITTGHYSDPQWWSKVNNALRFKGSISQRIQARLSELGHERKAFNALQQGDRDVQNLLRRTARAAYSFLSEDGSSEHVVTLRKLFSKLDEADPSWRDGL